MKKRILIIIAIIMIISTIIKTFLITGTFYKFAEALVTNQSIIIKEIIKKTDEKTIPIISNIKEIKDISIINQEKSNIQLDFINKQVIVYLPYKEHKSLKIIYKAQYFYKEIFKTLFLIIIFAILSLIIIILIVNYFITPYLNVLEEIQISTKKILKGDFSYQLKTYLKGEENSFVKSYNEFLKKLKESFGVIEQKYTSLIEKERTEDPLNDAKETIEQLANIYKFKKIIEEDENYKIILRRLYELVKEFNIQNFVIFVIDKREEKVTTLKTTNPCCNVENNYKECRAIRTHKVINEAEFEKICLKHTCQNHYICLPFDIKGNITLVLKIMFEDIKEYAYIKKKLPYIKAYFDEAIPILQSKYSIEKLHKESIKDSLTGLYNRRYLNTILPTLIEQNKKQERKVGFLMLDMDYFKKVNDIYGHDAGDLVLKQLSTLILSVIRKSDVAIRMGGEEFLVLLPGLNTKEELLKVATKIKNAIKTHNFKIDKNQTIKKTISIGGALFPDDCENEQECIKKADEALYKAKETRDTIVII